MSKETDDFAELRRLLVLKRHEVPPPGYYDRFAMRVMARIEARQMMNPEPWWKSIFSALAAPAGLRGTNAMVFAGMGLIAFSLFHIATSPAEEDGLAWTPRLPPTRQAWVPVRWSDSEVASQTPARQSSETNRALPPSGLFALPTANPPENVSFVFPGR